MLCYAYGHCWYDEYYGDKTIIWTDIFVEINEIESSVWLFYVHRLRLCGVKGTEKGHANCFRQIMLV